MSDSTGVYEFPLTVTEAAASRALQLLPDDAADGVALRVGVRPGGCSGFAYELFWEDTISESDLVASFGELRVVVDPESAGMLAGATLDFADDLMGGGFRIDNPNVVRTCGCGKSFC